MGKAPLSFTKASSREVLSNTYKEKKSSLMEQWMTHSILNRSDARTIDVGLSRNGILGFGHSGFYGCNKGVQRLIMFFK
jgi:hypothetical protein